MSEPHPDLVHVDRLALYVCLELGNPIAEWQGATMEKCERCGQLVYFHRDRFREAQFHMRKRLAVICFNPCAMVIRADYQRRLGLVSSA